MLVKVDSASNSGLKTIGVEVEVNVASRGLPAFDIVGLPGKAVAESRERVRTAITNSGIEFPQRKIIINLAPGDILKEGSCYDLPIAIGILSFVTGCMAPRDSLFFGELSLDGSLRHTKGALLLALFAKENGFKSIFVPEPSANEAAIVGGINIYPVKNLVQLLQYFKGSVEIKPAEYKKAHNEESLPAEFDMAEVLGQEQAKRALEISSSGGHNFLMVGSPGAGKTMLARALAGILPPLAEAESLEVTKIYSICGRIPPGGSLIKMPPFRAPHHTISQIGLTGGGSRPQPGEISLAHRGVLFLDEFNEFPRSVMEALRQPMEDGHLTISRSRQQANFPCRFILAASANPCPCGYLYHPKRSCTCRQKEIEKYRKRISGPIMDRIDLHIEVPVVSVDKLSQERDPKEYGDSSVSIRKRVIRARKTQHERFRYDGIYTNSEMKNKHIKKHCKLEKEVKQVLFQAARNFHLSARSYFKMIKTARTIADLEGAGNIEVRHMLEALQYRSRIRID